MLKCKQQCHGACSSEIGTCKINDDVRQAAHTKKDSTKTTRIHVLCSCFEGKFNFQRKKKTFNFFLPNSLLIKE